MIEDSLILFTFDYYKKNNNTGRLSRTYELAYSYYCQKNETTIALKIAEEGLQYNIEMNDSSEIAHSYDMLAEVYYGEKDYKTAISYWNTASLYDTGNPHWRDYMTGICYAWLDQEDSSAFFIQKSIDLALRQGDTISASHYIRNQADILYERRNYSESLSLMKKLKGITSLNAKSYITVSNLYLMLHQPDSAQAYLNIANELKSRDNNDSGTSTTTENRIMAMQTIIDYAQGKHINWSNFGQYNDSILRDSQAKITRIEEETAIRNRLEQKNLNLTINRQRILLALVSVSLLAAIIIIALLYSGGKRKEKIEVLQSMLQDAMHSNSNSNNKDDYFFKKILLQQLGLVRLVATTPTSQNQALLKQISNIANNDIPVEELLNWNDLYHTIDSIYDNFYTKLLQKYGAGLNDREIQLCCLLCAEFSTKEISVVTQQSVRTIYQRKTTIRQKLEMDEKDDIVAILKSLI